jgi:hypothetical protein
MDKFSKCHRAKLRKYDKFAAGLWGNNAMDEIPWHSEASLHSQGHVHCAGTFAQCIRRWRRLPEISQQSSYLKLVGALGKEMRISGEQLANLATRPDLSKL